MGKVPKSRVAKNDQNRRFLTQNGAFWAFLGCLMTFLVEFGPNITFSDICGRKMPKNPEKVGKTIPKKKLHFLEQHFHHEELFF